MNNSLFFSLKKIEVQQFNAGSIQQVTANEVSGFVNISFSILRLKREAFQVPIWHPDANKIGYCLRGGKSLVSLRTPEGVETFTVQEGDVFFIPLGVVHYLHNLENEENTILFAYNAAKPETMYLSQAFDSLSPTVFSSTFNTPASFLDGLKKEKKREFIKSLSSPLNISGSISSKYKFNIESSVKRIDTNGGYLKIATKTTLPILEGLGILGFGLNEKGVVEPHWHTNAGELVYIVKGQTRITVLSPSGKVDLFEVQEGEGVFAPASHFHNIENVGKSEVEVIAFFSHAQPDFIGIGEVIGSYPNEVLASIFNTTPQFFEKLYKPQAPQVIVPI